MDSGSTPGPGGFHAAPPLGAPVTVGGRSLPPPGAIEPPLDPPESEVGPRRRPSRRTVLVGLIVLALVAAGGLWWVRRATTPPVTRADVDRAVADAVAKARQEARATPPDAAAAYRTILPSLVVITTDRPSTGTAQASSGLGTGVVINQDGTVLTAWHVVSSGRITVQFTDGTTSPATVGTSRPEQDLATLIVQTLPEIVVPAVLGGGVGVGEDVFAVGNPLGLSRSLTAGVVSALGRDISVSGGITLHDLIQFDAAVNPGNSGGPLLNRDAQVVGVVTGLANPAKQAFFVGIGFAVPIGAAGGGAGEIPPK